jgi:hypothetical protein
VLVGVLVLENPDRFAIRLPEQISSIGLFAVTESPCTEDEHDDEDDSKFRNLGLTLWRGSVTFSREVRAIAESPCAVQTEFRGDRAHQLLQT